MKYNLLQMTQDILTTMGSDPADTISSTSESLQVATTIKLAYNNLMIEREWDHLHRMITLQSVNDSVNHPTVLSIVDTCRNLDWIKHNNRNTLEQKADFTDIKYLTPDEFITFTNGRDEFGVDGIYRVVDDTINGLKWKVRTDVPPQYWTSFDDKYVVFDAWNSSLSASILSADTLCKGNIDEPFAMTDDFVPNMPQQFFPVLLETARVRCFSIIKGETHALAEREVKRQRVMLQHKARRADDLYKRGMKYSPYRGVDYGRT